MPITLPICEQCGQVFTPYRNDTAQKFCGPTCYAAVRSEHHRTRPCEQCGKEFTTTRKREASQRFCTKACTSSWESEHGRPAAQVDRLTFTCRVCNEPFSIKPSIVAAVRKKWNRDPIYCSMKCMGVGRRLTDDQWQISCIQCGKPMPIQRKPGGTVNRQKALCSTECRSLFRRLDYQAKHPDQQPTRNKYKNGYVRIVVPGKNGEASRETLEHRYVMEQRIGRRLLPEETVHHVNGDRGNNDPSNLELFSSRHGPGQRVADKVAFAIEMLRLYPEFAREAGVELVDL